MPEEHKSNKKDETSTTNLVDKEKTSQALKKQSPIFVSIIIPVFNVENYIARCLESCINQTLKDIEIVVVDDCSSDNSMDIATSYSTKDARIKLVRNVKNLGTFHARLEGIKQASGRYMTFVDADDYIDLKTCEVLKAKILDSISKDGVVVDVAFFGMEYDPKTWKKVSPKIPAHTRYKDDVLKAVFLDYSTPPWQICAKFFRSSFLKDALVYMEDVPRLKMAEDVLATFMLLSLAKKSIGIKERFYIYCESSSSITRKKDAVSTLTRIEDLKAVIKEFNKLDSILPLSANKYFLESSARSQNILKAVIELEYRYDIRKSKSFSPYLKACFKSLKYYVKWQTFMRMALYIISLGKVAL
ncbi:hypothetical protein BKH43_03860 [Helicobacter sp. 13S00401-1]|uniref:glycosyltransferase family 2 protein n=1 Tax=Helicobacter sp. 13S00401-1 TaxID=1905758 RepID=UPI000BD65BE1|nr:glycosyltransferase family 2 protein [Helicobacter sp. 13S00401-1]PAF50708.1 hypothetical protein BKH43_03860 [Helicobacter sp. 13S00401-1]